MSSTWSSPNGIADVSRPVVFLPGWGFDGRILELLTPDPGWLRPREPLDPEIAGAELQEYLVAHQLERVLLVGWSMGANLALDFSRRCPERVAGLELVAMRKPRTPAEVEIIRREFLTDPRGFLASFYRKCFLGERGRYRRFLEQIQPGYLADPPVQTLEKGLEYLGRVQVAKPPVPVRQVHGRRDIIVPPAEMAKLPGAAPELLEHAGHMTFLAPGFPILEDPRKLRLRQRFSQAASTYDEYAVLQKEVADRLAESLQPAGPVRSILELGCGTGNYTARLAAAFPEAELLALDFSGAMLEAARRKRLFGPEVRFVCEDAETFLAKTGRSFDLVTSNATLQWFTDLEASCPQIGRVLAPGGTFAASIFGPDTLRELADGLQHLLGRPQPLAARSFADRTRLQTALGRGLDRVEVSELRFVRHYRSLSELLRSMKKTGTSGWQESSPPLFTRGRLQRLDDWFSRKYGGYQITYQVFLARGSKP